MWLVIYYKSFYDYLSFELDLFSYYDKIRELEIIY
jgi:hypothetical protein